MSMTKRYLESLPVEEQDAILGPVYGDDWMGRSENEPEQAYPDAEFEAYWATVEAENKRRADDEEEQWFDLWLSQVEQDAILGVPEDGPVECVGCKRIFPESALYYGKCDACYEANDDAESAAPEAGIDADHEAWWSEQGGDDQC